MLVHPTVQQIKQTNATYAETDLIKADSHGERSNREAAHAIKLNSSDWDKTLEKLAALFDGGHFAALSASPVRRTRPVPQAEASVGTLTHPKYTPLTHMNTGILPDLPIGDEFEEYISAFFQCGGFYMDRKLIERGEDEILELDIITTRLPR